MKHRRSTFRRKGGAPCNAAYFGYQAAYAAGDWDRPAVDAEFRAARQIRLAAPHPLPGETHRQLAARLRLEAAAEQPTKPARKSRAKAVAA